jgi:AcrR family transcriptional regulator
MPRAFTERERQIIQARLLEAGERLFASYGLRKTTVEELTAAAGISKGAFYLFYESKEALLMDVVEEAEKRFRLEVLAAVERPGPSAHARLAAVFRTAFRLWRTIPILRIITPAEYALMQPRIPAEKVEEHRQADYQFMQELVDCCRAAGIPIQAQAEQIAGLMYATFFASLHEDDLGPQGLSGSVDLLLELVAAYCLGEVAVLEESSIENEAS